MVTPDHWVYYTNLGCDWHAWKSNIFNKTVVPGQETHFPLLSTWTGWNRELYVAARSLVTQAVTHTFAYMYKTKKRWQSKKMLNNADNWVTTWMREYPFHCVVKRMDMHEGTHSENLASVVPYFLWGSPHSRNTSSHKSQKSKDRD